jgi:hypothetical protein
MSVDVQQDKRLIESSAPRLAWAAAEVGLIVLVFFLWGGGLPPDANEAHYLSKARHYWDPTWCEGDFFLDSADAHTVFYWTFGWVAALLSLPTAAWVGRVAMWIFQAWSWRRLSWAVAPRPLFSVLSGALLILLLDWCELAGEWIVDGVEAKGFAFGFVFLGIEALVRNRWRAMWLLFGAASAFHVLVGGWSVVAAGLAWLAAGKDRPRLIAMLPALAGGFVLALPGLIPGLALSRGVDSVTSAEANQIYVYYRLSHHLLPSSFAPQKYAAYAALLAAGLLLCVLTARAGSVSAGLRRLWLFTAGGLLIGLAGMIVFLATQQNPPLAAGLLRFYFFRLSDALAPLATVLTLGALLFGWETGRPGLHSLALTAAMLLAAAGVGLRFADRRQDFRPGADRQSLSRRTHAEYAPDAIWNSWRRLGEWIQENTPSDARFLTPRAQQTFKWYAQRAEVVTWKDVPQDAAALIEWRRRFQEVYGPVGWKGLTAYTDDQLLALAHRYNVQYVVIDRTRATRHLGWPRVYPVHPSDNVHFEIYQVPRERAAQNEIESGETPSRNQPTERATR